MSNQINKQSSLQKPYYFEEEPVSLSDLVVVFARHLKIIIIIPFTFCLIIVFYLLFFSKPVYSSTAKIMSSSGGSSISQASGLAAQFGLNIPTGQSEPKWVYPEIIKSRTLARSMLKQRFDTNKFGKQKTLLQILTYGKKKPDFSLDTLQVYGVAKLLKMISASEDLKTGIMTLVVEAPEPKLASEINSVLIEQLDSHQREYNKAKTSDTKQFIEGRILDTEKELIAAEEALKVFMDRNRRIENSPALQLEQQRLGREVTVLTGVFTTLKQQLETTKIEEVKESNYVIVLDPPEVPLSPSKPNKKLMVIIAITLGIGFGIVISFILDALEKTKKSEKNKIEKAKVLLIKNIYEMNPFNNS